MITYPVDVANTKWAVIQLSSGQIVGRNKNWPVADGSEIQGDDGTRAYLLEVKTTRPEPSDPDTTRVVADDPLIDITNNTITQAWKEVAISQEEQDAATGLAQAKAAYTAIKNGTGTSAQRLARAERVLAYMIKQQYG